MKRFILPLLILLALLLSSCRGNENIPVTESPPPSQVEPSVLPSVSPTPTPSAEVSPSSEPASVEVEENVIAREIEVTGEKVDVTGDLYISLPSIRSEQYPENAALISDYFAGVIAKLEENFELEINSLNDEGNEYGTPIVGRYLDVTYTTELNRENVVSFYIVKVAYSGGAHDYIELDSETFDISKGVRLMADNLFSVDREVYSRKIKDYIISEMDRREEEDSQHYYDQYDELVELTYDPENFVLTEEGLKVYFQLYDLAPYAAGTVTFVVPYDYLAEMWNSDYPA